MTAGERREARRLPRCEDPLCGAPVLSGGRYCAAHTFRRRLHAVCVAAVVAFVGLVVADLALHGGRYLLIP